MRLEIVEGLSDKLNQLNETRLFMEVIELRHRQFRKNKANVCMLDPYDLISTHLILKSDRDNRTFACLRVTSRRDCLKHDLIFPTESYLDVDPSYRNAYSEFLASGNEPLHMGMLALDPVYKDEIEGFKLIDLMVWLGFKHSGVDPERVAFAGTPNAKFHQESWLREIGSWLPGLPDFKHPVIPETHQMILIPLVSDAYWESKEALYGSLYRRIRRGLAPLSRAA